MNTVIGTASRIAAEQPAGAYPARMKLEGVLSLLRGVAPEHLAEDWDQVGLHLAGTGRPIRKALLCIDLTPAVLAEAIEQKCQLIVAYHPPIFHPLKRLADRDWKEQMLAEAVRKGIAVYSPHTALDAVRQGMNDWLCDGLGSYSMRSTIGGRSPGATGKCKIVVYVPRDDATRMREVMATAGAGSIGQYEECSFNIEGVGTFRGGRNTQPVIGEPGRLESVDETRVEMICWHNMAGEVVREIRKAHPYEEPAIDVIELASLFPPDDEEQGPGRIQFLKKPVTAATLISRVKRLLGVKKLKAAVPDDYGVGDKYEWVSKQGGRVLSPMFIPGKVQDIAVCVGAGGALFEKWPSADAYITGEMQHHQVLDLYLKGKVVILAGHTNTERPFLKNYREKIIEQGGGKVEWLLSEADRAPIEIV